MDADNLTIIVGVIFVLITLLVRGISLKKEFINKINLITSLGYCIFSYTSAIVIVKTFNLAVSTYQNSITLDIILQNKVYIFMVWLIVGLSALIAYISLLVEQHKNRAN